MLKDQLKCKDVAWDEEGNANVELDLDRIREKEKEVVKEIHHHHESALPIYFREYPKPVGSMPYWRITCKDGNLKDNMVYCSGGK